MRRNIWFWLLIISLFSVPIVFAELNDGTSGFPSSSDTYTALDGGDNTDHLPVQGAMDGVKKIGDELGTDVAQGKATLKAYLQTEHDTNGEHTNYFTLSFESATIDSTLSSSAIGYNAGITNSAIAAKAGSITGISCFVDSAITSGSIKAVPTIELVDTALSVTLNVTNPTKYYATQAKDTSAFALNNRLGVEITTPANLAPDNTANLSCTLFITYNE